MMGRSPDKDQACPVRWEEVRGRLAASRSGFELRMVVAEFALHTLPSNCMQMCQLSHAEPKLDLSGRFFNPPRMTWTCLVG